MLSSHSASWRTSHPRILYRLILLSSRMFPPQRNLILFISFPCNGHQQNIFCLLVSKTSAETIDCVTECLTYDILQLYCIKFHPNFRSHCGRVCRIMLVKIKYYAQGIMLSGITRETKALCSKLCSAGGIRLKLCRIYIDLSSPPQ